MNLFRKKSLLSVGFLPLWTGLGSTNKSTLLLRWRDVASIARTENLLHADGPTVWVHHALLVLHSWQDDGWAQLVPLCLLCLKRWIQICSKRNRLQKDYEPAASLLPWILICTDKSVTGYAHVGPQRWHLQLRKDHKCRSVLSSLKGNLHTAHMALPKAFSGGLWMRCLGKA